jgi:hypothetical protein
VNVSPGRVVHQPGRGWPATAAAAPHPPL